MGIKTKSIPTRECGFLRVLAQDESLNYEVELRIIRNGVNNNKWDFRNVEKFGKTFKGTPILCAFVGKQIGDGHNMQEVTDPITGEKRHSFLFPTAERIVGEIYDREDSIRIEELDGQTWVIGKGKLWRFYNPELVDKIAKQGIMEVSAETNVTRSEKNGDIEIFFDWYGLGVTILGDHVAPAVPGANIKALQEIQPKFHQLQLKAATMKNNQTKKGVKNLGAMNNKPLVKAVQERFPNHKLLNMNDDGTHVVMLAQDGSVCVYKGNADEHGVVIPDRIKPVALNATYQFEDNFELGVDVASLLATAVNASESKCANAESSLAQANERIKELETQVSEMQTRETARRVKAAEDAIQNALENAKCVGATAELAQDIIKDIHDGKYSSVCDADGEWIGDKKAVESLMAKIGMMTVNSAQAKKPVVSYSFDPEFLRRNAAEDGYGDDVESLVSRISD